MEGLISWKRLCFVLVSLLAIQGLFLIPGSRKHVANPLHIFRPAQPSQISPHGPRPQLDREIFDSLTAEQCDQEFPDLYREIDVSVKHWKDSWHTISTADVEIQSWRDDGAVRILIHNNELRILETKGISAGGYRERALSTLGMLQKAIWSATAGGEELPTIEAAIIVDDQSLIPTGKDTHTAWVFASQISNGDHHRHWIIPDFGFYSSMVTGSWPEARRRASENDASFRKKIPMAVWRGVTWTNPEVRDSLIEQTEGKDWADVKVIDWETQSNIVTMENMCKYAFTIHTEGRSYSGRLQYLWNCDSIPIIHDLDWKAHPYHLLVPEGPNQNYIPARRNWTDLEEKVTYFLDHPDEAQRIANNSLATFRNNNTSPAATSCYLRRLIQGYSTVSFTPEVERPWKTGGVAKLRGISFEEFIHKMDNNYDDGES